MAKCVRCGKRGLFLKLDNEFGLCPDCLTAERKRKEQEEQSRREQENSAYSFMSSALAEAEKANKATRFMLFMQYYNNMLLCLKNAAEIEKDIAYFEHIQGSPLADYNKLLKEQQWHMRDAIERQYDDIISGAKNKYRNNKSITVSACNDLANSIKIYEPQFDSETTVFANIILRKLCRRFDIDTINSNEVIVQNEDDFDQMDGFEFEFWCANLLKKNGFSNVEMTKGSGDQGVDIIAEKDEIRYAIQCKCYTADLGNTPIQEVCAGKVFYNCQIGVVMTNCYFTKAAKELAAATGTLLWDRDRILKMNSNKKSRTDIPIVSDQSTPQNEAPVFDDNFDLFLDKEVSESEYDSRLPEYDSRLPEAVEIVIKAGKASPSILKRRMHISYAQAENLISEMALRGIVSDGDTSKPRDVLITHEQFLQIFGDEE